MLLKIILIAATVLNLSQVFCILEGQPVKRANREYVEISNETYFVDTFTGFHRDETKAMCESINMKMVSFEADTQKWLSVKRWLNESGNHNFFWTDALKDEDSSEWYWETSGNIIAENDFHWGRGQPSMLENVTVRSCINFSLPGDGYDDDDCLDFTLDAMCQTTID